MDDNISIFDTTLRDGEQSPGFSMNIAAKVRMAHQLELLQVDVIEAGFPMASQGDFEAVRRIGSELKNTTVAALSRAVKTDIERCAKALELAKRPRIHTFLATSDIHLKHKLGMSREKALDMAVRATEFARTLCGDVEFTAEDAGRTDPDYLSQVLEAVIEAGASVFNITDTVGYCLPPEFGALIHRLRTTVKNIDQVTISVHCHDDLGLAVANSLSGIENGARQVECTINGIGERAGNAALEEVVMALQVRKQFFHSRTRVNTQHLFATSRLLADITSIPVQPNKAIVGANAFAHEAGIHQDGVLKNALTYEIMTPESVGVPGSQIVLGKHSGRHALMARLRALGFDLGPTEIEYAYDLFSTIADQKKKIDDNDLVEIAQQARPTTSHR